MFLSSSLDLLSFNPCSVGSCSGSLKGMHGQPAPCCFNPCSVGSCSGSSLVHTNRIRILLFQSLFCWIVLGEFGSARRLAAGEWFQSLFCWIVLGEANVLKLFVSFAQFQSLFCWIVLGEFLLLWFAKYCLCFNPCSVGSCSGRIAPANCDACVGMFQSLFCWIMLGESR